MSPAKALTNADGSAAIPAATAPAKTSRRARQAPSAQAADAEHADSGASNRVQPERTATGAGSREEERAESSRHSKRPAQRETAEKPSGAKRKVATESAAARRQNANRTSVGRGDFAWEDGVRSGNSSGPWQSRGRDQESNGWGDWGASDAPTARSARRSANVEQGVNWHTERGGEARWQERDWDRPASRRRDRSDEYGRDDDRRFKPGRDDFLMGRAERSEGWQTMVPSSRYRW